MVRDVVKANLTEAREPPYLPMPALHKQLLFIDHAQPLDGRQSVIPTHTLVDSHRPHGMICHFLNLSEGKLSKVLFEGPIHTPAVSWT